MLYFDNGDSVSVVFEDTGDTYTFYKEQTDLNEIIRLVNEDNYVAVRAMCNLTKMIVESNECEMFETYMLIDESKVDYDFNEFTKFFEVIQKKYGNVKVSTETLKPLLLNILLNPFINCKQELYDYCSNLDFEFTTDGCILAYKVLRDDYTSFHPNLHGEHLLHTFGKELVEPDFDNDRTNVCSKGLHFCAKDYIRSYSSSGKVIIVKVNPRDIVAIPTDYNFKKGRCIKYTPICDYQYSFSGMTTQPTIVETIVASEPVTTSVPNPTMSLSSLLFFDLTDRLLSADTNPCYNSRWVN